MTRHHTTALDKRVMLEQHASVAPESSKAAILACATALNLIENRSQPVPTIILSSFLENKLLLKLYSYVTFFYYSYITEVSLDVF